MNKVLLLLLFPVLIFNTSFCELLKLPQLVSHFVDHHNQNQQVGIWTFMEMHYFGQDINDNDDEEDMKLPFKKIHVHQTISIAIPVNHSLPLDVASVPVRTDNDPAPEFHYSAPLTGSLFRPPIS